MQNKSEANGKNEVTNLHLITVKYLGPTNNRGSRVKLTSDRFNQSVIIPYNYSMRDSAEMAKVWLGEHEFNIVGQAEMKIGHALLSDTFKPLKD